MLLVIIDIFERLISWLKSFTAPRETPHKRQNEADFQFFNLKPSHGDVRKAFDNLCNANNSEPKEEGVIVDTDTAVFVIGNSNKGERAKSNVWAKMSLDYGHWYDVKVSDRIVEA